MQQVTHPRDVERIELAPGVTAPAQFELTVADGPIAATVHMHADDDGAFTCTRVTIDRLDGQSLTARDVRAIRLGEMITGAPQRASSGAPTIVGDDQLQKVADVYRAALAQGQPPTRTVQATFQLSRRTAARTVSRAREAGYLGPTVKGRAGEIGHVYPGGLTRDRALGGPPAKKS